MYILLSLELTIPHARFCGLELGIQHISDSGLGYRLGLGLMFALVWHDTGNTGEYHNVRSGSKKRRLTSDLLFGSEGLQ